MTKRLLSTQKTVNLSTDPATGVSGETYFNTTNKIFRYHNGTSWLSSSGTIISDTAPSSPAEGMLWFDSTNGKTYIYYSSAWVEIGNTTAIPDQTGNDGSLLITNGSSTSWSKAFYDHTDPDIPSEIFIGSGYATIQAANMITGSFQSVELTAGRIKNSVDSLDAMGNGYTHLLANESTVDYGIYLSEGGIATISAANINLVGIASSATAAVDTNTTQVATTAYVVGQGYLKSATATSTYAPIASPAITGNATILDNSSSPALKITQTGAGVALLVEDIASVDSSPFIIDKDGKVGIGTTSPSTLKSGTVHLSSTTSEIRIESSDSTTGIPNSLLNIKRAATRSGGISFTDLSDTEVAFMGIPYNAGSTSDSIIIRTATVERMRITSTGNVGIGTANPQAQLHVQGTSNYRQWLQSHATSVKSLFVRANGTAVAPTTVLAGEAIGSLEFFGYDGAANQPAAQIVAAIDGSPGAGDMPGRMVFNTTPDGSATPAERMRITAAGNVGIGMTPVYKLDVNGTINATEILVNGAAITAVVSYETDQAVLSQRIFT